MSDSNSCYGVGGQSQNHRGGPSRPCRRRIARRRVPERTPGQTWRAPRRRPGQDFIRLYIASVTIRGIALSSKTLPIGLTKPVGRMTSSCSRSSNAAREGGGRWRAAHRTSTVRLKSGQYRFGDRFFQMLPNCIPELVLWCSSAAETLQAPARPRFPHRRAQITRPGHVTMSFKFVRRSDAQWQA